MKKFLIISFILMLFSLESLLSQTAVSVMYGISMKNTFNMGIDMKAQNSKWGGYFTTQGLGYPYTGETGTDYGDICDVTEITDYGVIENSVWGMSFGGSYNLFFKDSERSPFTLYTGIGFAEYIEISETYYYYKWLDFPELNEGNLMTYPSNDKWLPTAEVMLGIDFLKKGPVTLGIVGGFNTASLLICYAYLGLKM